MERRIIKHISYLFIILFILLTQSCPNPLLEKVEEDIVVFKAPGILSTIPPFGDDDTFLDTPVQIKFDKTLDVSTLTSANIVVTGESGVIIGTIKYNSFTKTITFNPDSNFEQQKDYTVMIKKDVKSDDGNSLIKDYSWKFSTGISTSKPDGSISALSETNQSTVTLNFTKDNVFVTKMSVYVESPGISKKLIDNLVGDPDSVLDRSFKEQLVYTHPVTAGNDENFTFSVIFWNDNNNYSDEKNVVVYVDKNPPDSPLVTGQSITNDQTPTWQWSSVPEAVDYRYSYNNSTWTEIGNVTSFTQSSILSDNTYILYVQARDSVGNWSSSGSKTTVIDSTVITPTVFISGNPTATSDSTPTWQWAAVTGATKYRYKLDNSTMTSGTTETSSLSYTPGILSDGSHTLYVQAGDDVPNWSATGSYTVSVDTAPPTVSSFRINNGSSYTISASVSLNSSVSGVYQMRFSNNNSTWSTWETYSNSKSWSLISGDGTKTVYAQYRDTLYNTTSTTISDTIILDTDTPSPTISINSGAAYSTADNRSVTAGVSISGDYTQLEFYDSTNGYSGFLSYSGTSVTRTVTFTSDGGKTIYVRAKDAAGHISGWVNDSITIDTIHPNAPSVTSSSSSPDTTPTWTWSSGGGGNGTYYREINDSTPDYSSTSTTYTPSPLPLADGSHRLYVTERDTAGNRSSAGSYLYTLNVTGITPDNGASVTATFTKPPGLVTLDWPNPLVFSGDSDTLYVGLYSSITRTIQYNSVYSGTAGAYTSEIAPGTYTYYWYFVRKNGKIIRSTSPVFQFTGTR